MHEPRRQFARKLHIVHRHALVELVADIEKGVAVGIARALRIHRHKTMPAGDSGKARVFPDAFGRVRKAVKDHDERRAGFQVVRHIEQESAFVSVHRQCVRAALPRQNAGRRRIGNAASDWPLAGGVSPSSQGREAR